MTGIENRNYLFHLCQRQAWEMALETGVYNAPSLSREGFIHCSHEHQILEVANHFYIGVPDLVLLWIDASRVKCRIIFERAPGESGEHFPHIYGALNLDAVISVEAFPNEEDGFFHIVPQPTIRT